MSMPEEQEAPSRGELLDRLKDLDPLKSQGPLAELAYRRAREALERALEEAAKVRLEALEDARATRERELTLLMESLKALRQSAETQIHNIVAAAEVEANQTRERARAEAERRLEAVRQEAEEISAEAGAIRHAAETRAREVKALEAEFDDLVGRLAERLGITDKPAEGWLVRLFRNDAR